MSWNRQIKIIYTICSNTLFFIFWATIINLIMGGNIDYRFYLLSLFAAFFLMAAIDKTKNIKLSLAVSFIVSEMVLFFLYGKLYIIFNSVYICFILFFTFINEEQEVNYELYRYRAKQAIASLMIIGFIFMFSNNQLQQNILKFYIIFLITVSILMRESRNYYYRIRNKKTFITNFVLTIGILFISLDEVFELVIIVFKFLMGIFYKLSDKLVMLIALAIQRPLEIFVNFIKSRISNNPELFDKALGNKKNQQQSEEAIARFTHEQMPVWLSAIFKIILLILIVYLAYRAIYKYRNRRARKYEDIIEEREKLHKEKSSRGYTVKKLIKNMLRMNNLKEQVLNIYKNFESKTDSKGIFKRYMTAKQLENVTKVYIKNPDNVAKLTEIYNEAKFSDHKLNKEKIEEMKDSWVKLKKEL